MYVEYSRNRDIFLKYCFMYFLNHILIVLGIDEKIIDMLPTENISYYKIGKIKIFDNLYDFKALTKSGRIIIFEFKKDTLRKKDLKQAFDYYKREYCKNNDNVRLILIVLSGGGRIKDYTKLDLTFHPQIIKTKKINKQKDLNLIKKKFENNHKLTVRECSLLIALPLFELNESEAEIVRQTCEYIKYKKHCIPEEKLDEVVIGIYLNIVEYIDENKQDELMEMIGMAEKVKGVLAMYKEEMKAEMRDDYINEVKDDIIDEIKSEVRDKVESEVRDEIKSEVRDEVETEVRNKVESQVRDEVETEVRNKIKEDIAKKLKGLLSPEEIANITGLSLNYILLL